MASEYIGKTISLISLADIRYQGVLHSIDKEAATVSLENVRSLGTEGRKGNPAEELPGNDNVYEFIVFRASDVKHLQIEPDAPAPPPPPQFPQDPAILNSGPFAGPPHGMYGAPPFGAPNPYGFRGPPPPPQPAYGYPPYSPFGQHPPGQGMFSPPPQQPAPQQAPAQSPVPPVPPAAAPPARPPAVSPIPPPAQRPIAPPQPAAETPQPAVPASKPSFASAASAKAPAAQLTPLAKSDVPSVEQAIANLSVAPSANDSEAASARGTRRGVRGGQNRASAETRRANIASSSASSAPSAPVAVPRDDFDFERANAKFDKEEGAAEGVSTPASGVGAGNALYDKKSSFFDNISSDLKERGEGGRFDRQREKQQNMAAFGEDGSRIATAGYGGQRRRGGPRRGGGDGQQGGGGGGYRGPRAAQTAQ